MIHYEVLLFGGARLHVEMDATGALAMLEGMRGRMERPRPVLEAMAQVMRQAYGRRFAEGGSPAWAPLANSTVAAKRMASLPPLTPTGRIPRRLVQQGAFGPALILIRTGALRDSYRQKGARSHVERIDEAEGTVYVGSSLPHARFHQQGTAGYVIRARFAKALAFPGSAGETILRRAVNHPGLVARPVLLTEADLRQMAQVVRDYLLGREVRYAA